MSASKKKSSDLRAAAEAVTATVEILSPLPVDLRRAALLVAIERLLGHAAVVGLDLTGREA